LLVINRMLFVREKYRPNRRSQHDPKNYFLNTLTETKKGSPISLGMLYLILCEELDLPIQGIVLPGFFVLTYQDPQNEFFIDVFNKGAFFMRKDLTRFLKEMDVEEDDGYYQASSNLDIVAELIRTLVNSYRQLRQEGKADEMQRLLDGLL
jgi:regulator of sirC expression with transglutaminase-like and TPR domain